ncbi:hypothetical protein EG329_005585 [Mollisiaceae sp. DMI_Dod_QoI]|nr:hypothetical protein EG329_005585 [Helotiales sp. DMI_Dod_QoI]
MGLIISILMLFGLFTSLADAAALPKDMSVPSPYDLPHPLGTMTFNGKLGSHQVQLNGSIQEIHAQMEVLHPDFDPDALLPVRNLTAREDELKVARKLVDRNKSDFYCFPVPGQNWQLANGYRIDEGIHYLETFDGLCGTPGSTCNPPFSLFLLLFYALFGLLTQRFVSRGSFFVEKESVNCSRCPNFLLPEFSYLPLQRCKASTKASITFCFVLNIVSVGTLGNYTIV